MKLAISIPGAPSIFAPGEMIQGNVHYQDRSDGDQSLSVRLFWYTTGKGDRDVEIVDSIDLMIPDAQTDGNLAFEFTVPGRPLSVSGKLLAISWAIEAVVFPSQLTQRYELIVSTTGQAIELTDQSEKLESLGLKKSWLSITQP